MADVLSIYSGGSLSIQGGSGGGGAISAVNSATCPETTVTATESYANMPTNAAVTLTTGTSALVTLSASVAKLGAPGTPYTTPKISVAVSGATTIAASDANCMQSTMTYQYETNSMCRTFQITGLTPGSNTFTMKLACLGSDKSLVIWGDITVQALA